MKINELQEGKWYRPTPYPDYYYKFIEISKSSRAIITNCYRGKHGEFKEKHLISNSEFWESAKEIPYSEISHLIPKDWKEQEMENYSIF